MSDERGSDGERAGRVAQPRDDVDANQLRIWQRLASGAAGLALGVTGAIGVFADGSSAGGVPLLLGAGAVFGYIALTGQTLTRIKVGDSEAAFSRVNSVLQDPDIEASAKADVAEHFSDTIALPQATRRLVNDAIDAGDAERQYRAEVAEAVGRVMATIPPRLPGSAAADDQTVPVLTLWRQESISADKVWELMDSRGLLVGGEALVVLNQPLRSSDGRIFETLTFHRQSGEVSSRASAVVWRSQADDVRLNSVVRGIVSRQTQTDPESS